MRSPNDLNFVRENGLCVACGACSAVDEAVSVALRKSGDFFEPVGDQLGDKVDAADVCPSLGFNFESDGRELIPTDDEASVSSSVGQYRSIHFAQSTDSHRSFNATSGAVIPELASAALQTGMVTQVISLVHSGGLEYEAQGISRISELSLMPRSVYHAVNFENAYSVLQGHTGLSAVIALPCQLEGLAKVLAKRPELRPKVGLTIGLMCAWAYSRQSVEVLETYSGREKTETTSVQHRGGGPFGKYRVFDSGKELQSYNRRKDIRYLTAFSRDFNLPRCSICTNHLNYLADVVVGDSWIPETRFSKSGISLVIARSQRGETILQETIKAQKIRTTPARPVDVLHSEGSALTFAHHAYDHQSRVFGSHRVVFPNAAALPDESSLSHVRRRHLREFAIRHRKFYLYFFVKWSRDGFKLMRKILRYVWVHKLGQDPRRKSGEAVANDQLRDYD